MEEMNLWAAAAWQFTLKRVMQNLRANALDELACVEAAMARLGVL